MHPDDGRSSANAFGEKRRRDSRSKQNTCIYNVGPLVRNEKVAGSIPVGSTIHKPALLCRICDAGLMGKTLFVCDRTELREADEVACCPGWTRFVYLKTFSPNSRPSERV